MKLQQSSEMSKDGSDKLSILKSEMAEKEKLIEKLRKEIEVI